MEHLLFLGMVVQQLRVIQPYLVAVAAGMAEVIETVNGIKLMVCGFPALAALGSFCCFTFIWCINADVRAKMAEWKAAKAAK